MFNEENIRNPLPFEKKAFYVLFLSKSIGFLILMAVFFAFSLFLTLIGAMDRGMLTEALLVLVPVFLLGLLPVYGYSREYFKRFIFDPRAEILFVRKGVILPSYTMIPYRNIQDIHLDMPVIEKTLGLCNVLIYTATYSRRGSETLPGMSPENAEVVRQYIFSRIREVREVVD